MQKGQQAPLYKKSGGSRAQKKCIGHLLMSAELNRYTPFLGVKADLNRKKMQWTSAGTPKNGLYLLISAEIDRSLMHFFAVEICWICWIWPEGRQVDPLQNQKIC